MKPFILRKSIAGANNN